jgi:signal transduction histidine kinase
VLRVSAGLVVVAVAALTVAAVWLLIDRADRSRRAQTALAEAGALVEAIRGVPWEAQDPTAASRVRLAMGNLDGRIDSILGRLDALDPEEQWPEVLTATEAELDRALPRLYTAIASGDLEAAGRVDMREVAPVHGRLRDQLTAASSRYAQAARSAIRTTVIGSAAVIVAVLAALGFLLHRTRAARAQAEAARRLLAEQNERLRELDRVKDDFVASVSHELRSPLTSIRGYLELLREDEAGELEPVQRQFVDVVDRNAERLQLLVNDLLFVARLDAGRLELHRGVVSFAELVAECVEAARPAADDKRIELVVEIDPCAPICGDGPRLAQLLDNLVGNAIKFTPEGGLVAVRARERDGGVQLEVADTGIGISREDQRRLFERFFRAANATEQAIPGTGLGLSIARAIADAHSGSIAVEGELGAGTTFRVFLPAQPPDPHESCRALAAEAPVGA